jgi:hypothetical protein
MGNEGRETLGPRLAEGKTTLPLAMAHDGIPCLARARLAAARPQTSFVFWRTRVFRLTSSLLRQTIRWWFVTAR